MIEKSARRVVLLVVDIKFPSIKELAPMARV
jgi:hypothetical protein